MNRENQIITMLNDTSFPQVMLLDGDWGSGKTYFIKSSLITALTQSEPNKNVYYMSLYGVTNVNDFRDKVISLTMTGNIKTNTYSEFAGKLLEGLGNNNDQRGLGAIFNGTTGALKYALYSKINECTFIFDDLERINDKSTIRDILGECLNMVETKSVKIIVVANERQMVEAKEDIEKVFSYKYKFRTSIEDIVQILKSEFDFIDGYIEEALISLITDLKSTNIRVLKRSLFKFKELREKIINIEGVRLESALTNTLNKVVRICFAKDEKFHSKDAIIKAIENIVARNIDPEYTTKDIDTIFDDNFYDINYKMIDYCCDGIYDFTDIAIELKLPVDNSNIIDKLVSYWHRNFLSDTDFIEAVSDLEHAIKAEENLDVNLWYSRCDCYYSLIENNIIANHEISKEEIIDICTNAKSEKFAIPETINDIDSILYERQVQIQNKKIKDSYISMLNELNALSKMKDMRDFSKDFVCSWMAVKNEAYQKYMTSCFIDSLGMKTIEQAFQTWNNVDFYEFDIFLTQRLRYANAHVYLKNEIMKYDEIIKYIESFLNDLKYGLKFSHLVSIKKCLSDAYDRMINAEKSDQQ